MAKMRCSQNQEKPSKRTGSKTQFLDQERPRGLTSKSVACIKRTKVSLAFDIPFISVINSAEPTINQKNPVYRSHSRPKITELRRESGFVRKLYQLN